MSFSRNTSNYKKKLFHTIARRICRTKYLLIEGTCSCVPWCERYESRLKYRVVKLCKGQNEENKIGRRELEVLEQRIICTAHSIEIETLKSASKSGELKSFSEVKRIASRRDFGKFRQVKKVIKFFAQGF